MIYAGLDPGKQGCLAVIFPRDSGTKVETFPTKLIKSADGAELIDPGWLFVKLGYWSPSVLVVERQHPRPMDGKKSVFSLGRGYGRIEAAVDIIEQSVRYVTPQEWKKKVLHGTKKDKAAAIAWVKNMYPEVDLNPPGWEDKDHDGVADAVCLAYFGMKHL